jgi:hypothetical protein
MPDKKKRKPNDTPPPAPAADGPETIRRNFRAVAAATGTPSPDASPSLPTVDVRATVSAMASQVGMILHGAPLFRHALGLVTADEGTGTLELMTPERFVSWVEDHLAFVRWTNDGAQAESIGKDLSGKLLAADRLKAHLRELKGIHPVRLPAWRGEGAKRTVELAAVGHDLTTGILTLDAVPYPEDLPAQDGLAFLLDTLRYFGWEAEGEAHYAKRRSFAGMLAAMLGTYCHGLFPEGTAKPLIVFNGNQPGTGKSLLARMSLCAVHGAIPEGGKPETESELEKVLDSAALSRRPFLLLDDVANLRSQSINRFITSPAHECRRMHSQSLMTAPKITQVFATGNGLTITEDLERRAVIVDLFEADKATARTFPKGKEITNEWLALPETRARFLAALWCFVREWRNAGMPAGPGRKPSFERWAAVIGGILASASRLLADPFGPRLAITGGDESTRALERVLAIVAARYATEDAPRPNTAEIQEAAEAEDLLETITGFAKDARKSLGWKLKRIRGRHFTDTRGRVFQFGQRDVSTGAAYPITFLALPAGT